MAKKIEAYYHDKFLEALAEATAMHATSAEPANHAGIAAVSLADVTLTAGTAGADYSLAAGDVSGRKLTVAQQADVPIDATGEATHVVLTNATNIWVTTCTAQQLTSGGTVTFPSFDAEIAAPT